MTTAWTIFWVLFFAALGPLSALGNGPEWQCFGLLGGLDEDGAVQGVHRALLVRVGDFKVVVPRA